MSWGQRLGQLINKITEIGEILDGPSWANELHQILGWALR